MEKLTSNQTKDRIAAALRREILSGAIADGAEITQEQVASRLGVSRMPVREALQLLELEGLLLRLPNRHMRVVGLRVDSARENLAVLAALEGEAAVILARSGRDYAPLRGAQGEHAFHCGLSELTGNHYIASAHRRLLDGYPLYIWQEGLVEPERLREGNNAILGALDGGERAEIRRSVRRYYGLLADALAAHIVNQLYNDKKQ